VFLSDDTTKSIIADLLAMGAADFILKPIQRGVLLERVKQVLIKKSKLEESKGKEGS